MPPLLCTRWVLPAEFAAQAVLAIQGFLCVMSRFRLPMDAGFSRRGFLHSCECQFLLILLVVAAAASTVDDVADDDDDDELQVFWW